MQAYAVFAINEQLEYLLAEAAQRRNAKRTQPSLRARLASVVASVGAAIDGAAETARNRTPRTTDYPYKA